MNTVEINYVGNLRNKAIHVRSKNALHTDAPLDNNGKGESFSPTDLFCTSLVTCMLTIMGISAQEKSIPFADVKASLIKVMYANPRRVGEIKVQITIHHNWNDKQKQIMTKAVLTCPVAKSISDKIDVDVTFNYA